MLRAILLSITVLVFSQGCTTPARTIRKPDFNAVSTTGVGDAIYRFEYTAPISRGLMGEKLNVPGNDDYTFELLYGGVARGQLNVTYREFVNDLARPSFSQEAKYDYRPGEKNSLTFKGARVEVLLADNNEVKYRVEKGFSTEKRFQ